MNPYLVCIIIIYVGIGVGIMYAKYAGDNPGLNYQDYFHRTMTVERRYLEARQEMMARQLCYAINPVAAAKIETEMGAVNSMVRAEMHERVGPGVMEYRCPYCGGHSDYAALTCQNCGGPR